MDRSSGRALLRLARLHEHFQELIVLPAFLLFADGQPGARHRAEPEFGTEGPDQGPGSSTDFNGRVLPAPENNHLAIFLLCTLLNDESLELQ